MLLRAYSLKYFECCFLGGKHRNTQLQLRLLADRPMQKAQLGHRQADGRTDRKWCALEIQSLTICTRWGGVGGKGSVNAWRLLRYAIHFRHPCRYKMFFRQSEARGEGRKKLEKRNGAPEKEWVYLGAADAIDRLTLTWRGKEIQTYRMYEKVHTAQISSYRRQNWASSYMERRHETMCSNAAIVDSSIYSMALVVSSCRNLKEGLSFKPNQNYLFKCKRLLGPDDHEHLLWKEC